MWSSPYGPPRPPPTLFPSDNHRCDSIPIETCGQRLHTLVIRELHGNREVGRATPSSSAITHYCSCHEIIIHKPRLVVFFGALCLTLNREPFLKAESSIGTVWKRHVVTSFRIHGVEEGRERGCGSLNTIFDGLKFQLCYRAFAIRRAGRHQYISRPPLPPYIGSILKAKCAHCRRNMSKPPHRMGMPKLVSTAPASCFVS